MPGLPNLQAANSAADLYRHNQVKKDSILRRIRAGTEGTTVLVGSLSSITKPITAFVRLACGIIMPSNLEVPLPVRFVFVLLTPKPSPNLDFHEVGRSFATLMSNPRFHEVCYKVSERQHVLNAINEFLDESVVLPPGDYSANRALELLNVDEITNIARRRRKAREATTRRRESVVAGTTLGKISEDERAIYDEEGTPDEEADDEPPDYDVVEKEKRQNKDDPFFRLVRKFKIIWKISGRQAKIAATFDKCFFQVPLAVWWPRKRHQTPLPALSFRHHRRLQHTDDLSDHFHLLRLPLWRHRLRRPPQ
jgi:hypothetical protein